MYNWDGLHPTPEDLVLIMMSESGDTVKGPPESLHDIGPQKNDMVFACDDKANRHVAIAKLRHLELFPHTYFVVYTPFFFFFLTIASQLHD